MSTTPPQPAQAHEPAPEETVVPLPKAKLRPRKAPAAGTDELVLPRPAKKAPRTVKITNAPAPTPPVPIEELLSPLPRGTLQQGQRCLAIMMQTTGHSLDLGCRLCFTNCVYAGPCGCGGWDCIDRRNGEVVVFKETVKGSRRQRKREAKAARKLLGIPTPSVVWKLLRPWTWFASSKS